MAASSTDHTLADVGSELAGWLVAGGTLTMMLFPFAMPLLILTGLLVVPLIPLLLPVLLLLRRRRR